MIPRRPHQPGSPTPLSFAQQRLWFLDQLRPNTSTYNLPQVVRLTGTLDVCALERALNEIRRRHDILRANFHSVDGEPVQVVAPFQPAPLPVVDCTHFPADQQQPACDDAIDLYSRPPFDLTRDPLMRSGLIRLSLAEHVLVVTVHHIVSDGWSTRLLMRECAALYDAFSRGLPSPLADLPIQYSDYASWQRARLQGDVLGTQLAYWKQHLEASPPALELPADGSRRSAHAPQPAFVDRMLPAELVESLTAIGQSSGATLFMTLLAAFEVLLYRVTGQEEFLVGTPMSGRAAIETEQLLGVFINTLPIRATVSNNPTFAELLGRVRSVVLDAMRCQEVPFEKLVEELQPERTLSHTPLFQVMVNAFLLDDAEIAVDGLRLESLTGPAAESKFDLTLYILKDRGNIRLDLTYNGALFGAQRMEELLAQFVHLLQQIASAPDMPVEAYSMVTERARHFLPDASAALSEPYFAPVTEEFRRRVSEAPHQTAVVQSGRSWSYGDLAERANTMAGLLLARGLRRGEVVAVAGSRSVGVVAAIVGVFTSGGVLLTIDRNLPIGRQRLMLSESRARYLLYVGEWRSADEWMRTVSGLEVVSIGADASTADPAPAASLPALSPNDPAYIFFTSGTTTGIPKGVRGCHKGLSHFLAWQMSTFHVGPADRCAQITSLSFDVILRDIFLPLVAGATLCLPDEAADPASTSMLQWMDREGVTLCHVVPSLAQAWLSSPDSPAVAPRHLRLAFLAGEPLTDALVTRWLELTSGTVRIVNFYGPTETTLAKCFHVVPDPPSPGVQRIGRPLPDTQALILNGRGELCGVGEPGQIAIRTAFRTLGYINADDDQRKRFVSNAFRRDPGDLIYMTGDRGRYGPDGVLEFLGRMDDQIKIRGVRIEPAEVAAILGRHPKVAACFVTGAQAANADTVLVAYVVPAGTAPPGVSELRSHIADQLPPVMVPGVFVFLPALPLTRNGKIDRRALPAADLANAATRGFRPATTAAEAVLVEIWCRILNRDRVGVDDNFFELGGHSLIATRLVSQIRNAFNVELPLHLIFTTPTIEGLTLHLLERRANIAGTDEIESLLAEIEALPEAAAEGH